MKPKYIVVATLANNEPRYIKYTAKFGDYHGHIRLTTEKEEARMWDKEVWASRAARCATARSGPQGFVLDKLKYQNFVFTVEVKK